MNVLVLDIETNQMKHADMNHDHGAEHGHGANHEHESHDHNAMAHDHGDMAMKAATITHTDEISAALANGGIQFCPIPFKNLS